MRKMSLFLICVMALSACTNENEKPIDGYSELRAFFNEAFTSSLHKSTEQLKSTIQNSRDRPRINRVELINNVSEQIALEFRVSDRWNSENFQSNFDESRSAPTSHQSNQTSSSTNSIYSKEQNRYLLPFAESISKELNYDQIPSLVEEFDRSIASSDLNEEEKYQLFTLSSVTISLHSFTESGGFEDLLSLISENGGVSNLGFGIEEVNCSISTRSIFKSAVIGFFGGAVGGCISVGIGGTAVLPVIGTITGCVAGGVIGGAGGFIGGALEGLVSELLDCIF